MNISSLNLSKINKAVGNITDTVRKSKLLIENWCISCHDFKGIKYKSYDFVLSWLKKSGYKISNYTPHNTKNIWRNYYLYGSKNNND